MSGNRAPQSFVAYVVDAPGKSVDVEEIIKGGVDTAAVEEAIAVE